MEINELNKNANGGTEIMQRGLHARLPPSLLDDFQIICSRARELDPNRKKVYWLHDLPNDPEVAHLKDGGWKKFDKLVFVSNWQMQMYNAILGVPYSHSVVIPNAITPIEEYKKPDDKVRLIYFSTPHRGLNILYHVFDTLYKRYGDEIELDVYSSFKLYGWEERDRPFQDLFDACRKHPGINYHGAVSNDEIRKALTKSHIFAYPSIWPETGCICLMEAMSAGLKCVHPNYAALPETSGGLTNIYQWNESMEHHAQIFERELEFAIQEIFFQEYQYDPEQMTKQYADHRYNWEYISGEWEYLLDNVLGVC